MILIIFKINREDLLINKMKYILKIHRGNKDSLMDENLIFSMYNQDQVYITLYLTFN